jgi:hypothetical protein
MTETHGGREARRRCIARHCNSRGLEFRRCLGRARAKAQHSQQRSECYRDDNILDGVTALHSGEGPGSRPSVPLSKFFKCFPGLNFTTLLAGISMGSSVLGFRQVRASRARTMNAPNPEIITRFPLASASPTSDSINSSALSAQPRTLRVYPSARRQDCLWSFAPPS